MAMLAIESAFSFPGIPMWEGTHINVIFFFILDISFCVCWTTLFFGCGLLVDVRAFKEYYIFDYSILYYTII